MSVTARGGAVYSQRFPIRIHDVDAAGIVFFARYFYLMHDVYESFLDHLGHGIAPTIANTGHIIPIARAESRYHRSMRHGETITARLRLTELKRSSFVVETRFLGPDDILRATITSRHVCVHATTMKPIALPGELRDKLAAYLSAEGAT